MGRKRQRKRERLQAQRTRHAGPAQAWLEATATADSGFGFMLLAERRPPQEPNLTCASCHEFVEDGELGRGTCLHPGSGVLSPWHDTEACPFHTRYQR